MLFSYKKSKSHSQSNIFRTRSADPAEIKIIPVNFLKEEINFRPELSKNGKIYMIILVTIFDSRSKMIEKLLFLNKLIYFLSSFRQKES
jgi:hypothetical protein